MDPVSEQEFPTFIVRDFKVKDAVVGFFSPGNYFVYAAHQKRTWHVKRINEGWLALTELMEIDEYWWEKRSESTRIGASWGELTKLVEKEFTSCRELTKIDKSWQKLTRVDERTKKYCRDLVGKSFWGERKSTNANEDWEDFTRVYRMRNV